MSPDDDHSDELPSAPAQRGERRSSSDYDEFFNKQFEEKPRLIEPGQILCGDSENEMYVATVGSGVIATMYDTELKIGAMCYILVPPELLQTFPHFEKADSKLNSLAIKPLDNCIAEMKKRGAGKHRIQMRLIGGSAIPGAAGDDAGTKNYIFVREYITRKGLSILNEDLGGKYVRRVHFFPTTGRAVRMVLRRTADFEAIQALEKKVPVKI
jgi:chemotaxis protein CheD